MIRLERDRERRERIGWILQALRAVRIGTWYLYPALDGVLVVIDGDWKEGGWRRRIVEALEARHPRERARREDAMCQCARAAQAEQAEREWEDFEQEKAKRQWQMCLLSP
mmetsp:Transcript_66874/g.211639  ORF Transcript_66874/g.211639 Transcript_66874/m.211639 type:complete len:110 (+) Transcript_66874:756-1085(+)